MTRHLSLLILAAAALWAVPVFAGEEEPEDPNAQLVRQKLSEGWTYLEAGSLPKAEAAFTAAYETRVGKDRADVYYSLSAVWWERRNAMASYSWLREAEAAAKSSWYWDGGEDGEWDRRIQGRLRYIERNFTVVKLRSPKSGRPLPPLADPPPADPLLMGFVDALAGQVAEGADAGASVQWFFLPNGTFWVGGDPAQTFAEQRGELEPSEADGQVLGGEVVGLEHGGEDRAARGVRGRAHRAPVDRDVCCRDAMDPVLDAARGLRHRGDRRRRLDGVERRRRSGRR